MEAKDGAAIDTEYERLLCEIRPHLPRDQKENARLLKEIEKLMLKGKGRTYAESEMLSTLASLVHEYEQRAYPREVFSPAEMLEFLMEQRGAAPADLPLSPSRVSEILSGKRDVSKTQAIDLSKFFRVSPALFIASKK